MNVTLSPTAGVVVGVRVKLVHIRLAVTGVDGLGEGLDVVVSSSSSHPHVEL